MEFGEFRNNQSEYTVGHGEVLFDYFIASGVEPFVLIASGCTLSLVSIPVDMEGSLPQQRGAAPRIETSQR